MNEVNKMNEEGTIFEEDVLFAISPSVREKNYQIIITNFPVKSFDAIEQNKGKDPNDVSIELKDGSSIRIELKNRREGAKSYDMALEVHNDFKSKRAGWPFKLIKNEVDYLIYVWHGKKRLCYIILKARELEKWWRDNYTKYELRKNKPSTRRGSTWQSTYCFVPIKNFPKEIVHKHVPFIDLNDFWK